MATLGFTNVTTAILSDGMLPITGFGEDELVLQVWRCTGGTVGDTVTIPATGHIADIRSVVTGGLPASNGLSSSAANTQVVLTLTASAATTVTFDVWLLGRRE